ncbi:MAG TPA: hypothetical protein VIK02_05525 [Candidatus Anoxymicrobiaceae bacterium]
MNSEKGKSTVIATIIAASSTILAIGALNFIGEASEGFKEFLTFWQGMGPLSGKVILAYALGALVFLVLFRIKPLGRQSLVTWTIVLFASIAVSSLLIFTPFIDLVL